jgi:hypothetical protein
MLRILTNRLAIFGPSKDADSVILCGLKVDKVVKRMKIGNHPLLYYTA